MPLSTYPRGDFDSPPALSALLGSFWTNIYGADGELTAFLQALGGVYGQLQRQFDEALESVAYKDIPLRHVEEWSPIVVKQSDLTNPQFALLRYGPTSSAAFGSAGLFGVPTTLTQFPVSIAPADGLLALQDSPFAPAVCLVAGIDFRVDPVNQVAWLAGNPFTNPALTPTPLFGPSGAVQDYELTLWAWHSTVDEQALQDRIGYVLGLSLPSTSQARELAVTLVDALVNGTSELTIRRLFSALYDAPLASGDGEVVALVAYDQGGLLIVTDRYVYRYTAAASPVVSVGQVVMAGDPLADTLRFASLSSGAIPAGLPALGLGPAALGSCYNTGVVFADCDVPVDAVPAPAGGCR